MTTMRIALALLLTGCAGMVGEPDGETGDDLNVEAAGGAGALVIDGRTIFPIGLSNPPPLGGLAPSGQNGIDAVIDAGVNILKVNPKTDGFNDADLTMVRKVLDQAANRGIHTWVNLKALSRAQPGTPAEARLKQVIGALQTHPGLGLWKGDDEPWWADHPPAMLRHAWMVGKAIDPEHDWVLIEAPKGTAGDLAPYSAVTDIHGVDVYPVKYGVNNPDLHDLGRWVKTIQDITPSGAVVATLQVCWSGGHDGAGHHVLPNLRQERYMIYDAIMNGAHGLFFFGGHMTQCLSDADAPREWNWGFWNSVLGPLVREIGPGSEFYPALLVPGTGLGLAVNDSETQVMSRVVRPGDVWVVIARRGPDTREVRVSGLPSGTTSGTVYTEGRTVKVQGGAFTDRISQWGVHVYHFVRPGTGTGTDNDTGEPPLPTEQPAECAEGAKDCVDGDLYIECSGGVWSEAISCGDSFPGTTCSEGYCRGECTEGQKECLDNDRFIECAGGVWSEQSISCGESFPGTTCSGGYCVGCSAGEKACVDGDRYIECNADGSGWSNAYSCEASFPGTTCSSGYCVGN
jgi:hypothetical protein